MPFEIIRNDITEVKADAIVNTANPKPVIGSGVDSMMHRKAGDKLLEARKKIGAIPMGGCAVTPAFNLNAKYIIHTAGPIWIDGKNGEEAALRSCYRNCLAAAEERKCQSIAFPLISTGNYGFPKEKALQIAISEFGSFLMDSDIMIYLVVFSRDAVAVSEKLFSSVKSFIDDNYIQEKLVEEYGVDYDSSEIFSARRRNDYGDLSRQSFSNAYSEAFHQMEEACCAPLMPGSSLEDELKNLDAGFSEYLLALIDKTGKTDAEIYKKANLSRKLFSKIRNNTDYKPKKKTALAFAFALELDLEGTKELLSRAGFALSRSSKSDVIVEYFIVNKNYDLFELNAVLFSFDQELIGA